MSRTGRNVAVTIPVLLLLAVLAVFLRNTDLSSPSRLLPRCSFHVLTGWHCPGCGNTRATHALLHGDPLAAIRQNALFVVGLPFLLFWAFRSWMQWVCPQRVRALPFRWRQNYTHAIVIVVVVFGVLRNIPIAPFTWLAPVPQPVKVIRVSEVPGGPLQYIPLPESR